MLLGHPALGGWLLRSANLAVNTEFVVPVAERKTYASLRIKFKVQIGGNITFRMLDDDGIRGRGGCASVDEIGGAAGQPSQRGACKGSLREL